MGCLDACTRFCTCGSECHCKCYSSTTATTTEEDVNKKQRPEIIYFDGDDAPGTTREFGVDLDAAQARIQSLPESRPLGI